MTSRELLIRAMMGEKVERIPTMPQLCHDTAVRLYEDDWIEGMRRCVEDPPLIYDHVIRLCRELRCDGLRLFPLSPPARTIREGDEVFQVDADSGEAIGQCDLHGGGWIMPLRPPPPIETIEDAEQAVAATRYSDEQIDLIRDARGRVPDLFLVGKPGGLSLDPYTELRGRDNAYEDLILRPDFVRQVHDMLLEVSVENGRRLIEAGVDAFYIGDAASSSSLISPKHFAEFSLPVYQEFCRCFADDDVLIDLHVCGNISPILELMADSGVCCIEPLDTLAGVSVADAKRRVGDRVVLMGGVHTMTLCSGTPEEVRQESIRCCLEGGPERYILATADMVPPGTPLANLEAMVAVARDSLWRGAGANLA